MQCGMLIESNTIRELLEVNAYDAVQWEGETVDRTCEEASDAAPPGPGRSPISMNPIPALVILLLGTMMTSHGQDSMVSTMVHKQWGNLLTGSSAARTLTYVLVYLKPPLTTVPSRPPTELLTSFGLISGGILLMVSVSLPKRPVRSEVKNVTLTS